MSDPKKPPKQPPPKPPEVGDLQSLMERAGNGDPSALPALRAALDARPDLWRRFGDIARHARAAWIKLCSGTDLGMAEAMNRKVAELQAELAGPTPPPLIRLLVERVVATWLQVSYDDAMVARAAPDTPLKQMAFALRRQAQAHRSHLQAMGALAAVQRFLPSATGQEQIQAKTAVTDRVIDVDAGSATPCAESIVSGSRPDVADTSSTTGATKEAFTIFKPPSNDEQGGG